uniref:Uncharacterized protein n=1 Tax=Oryza brachyantha TaxID=4533 RepID=J3LNG3_ORYBR
MEEVAMVVVKVLVSLCCVGACCLAAYLYCVVWVAPRRVLAEFRRQGIGGPRPSFPYGNLADMRRRHRARLPPRRAALLREMEKRLRYVRTCSALIM